MDTKDFKTVLKCYKAALKEFKASLKKDEGLSQNSKQHMEDLAKVYRIGLRDLAERIRESVETNVTERLEFSRELDKIEKQF